MNGTDDVISCVDELVALPSWKHSQLPAYSIDQAAELHEVIGVEADVDANCPRHVALELRREGLERGINVASVEGRVGLTHDPHVLLRHRHAVSRSGRVVAAEDRRPPTWGMTPRRPLLTAVLEDGARLEMPS